MYKQNIQNLTEQFYQAHINSPLEISYMVKLATHPNLKKFNDDKIKLKRFFVQLNLKLQCNIDYFIKEKQNIKQKKLNFAILRLEKNAFAQIEAHVSAKNINFDNVNQFVKVLKTCFGKVNLISMTKHKLYKLYQTNKDIGVFLNTFLQLFKKAKIDNFQALDILYKKVSDEFQDRLIIVRKVENFNNLILLFCNINANIKRINKQS